MTWVLLLVPIPVLALLVKLNFDVMKQEGERLKRYDEFWAKYYTEQGCYPPGIEAGTFEAEEIDKLILKN